MTKLEDSISYKTNVGWFDSHNNVELMSTPKNKKALPEAVRQFLMNHEHDEIEVTITIISKCNCSYCKKEMSV